MCCYCTYWFVSCVFVLISVLHHNLRLLHLSFPLHLNCYYWLMYLFGKVYFVMLVLSCTACSLLLCIKRVAALTYSSAKLIADPCCFSKEYQPRIAYVTPYSVVVTVFILIDCVTVDLRQCFPAEFCISSIQVSCTLLYYNLSTFILSTSLLGLFSKALISLGLISIFFSK